MNQEIEANIQITREIEAEIFNCSEIESALAVRESELSKTLYVSHFEIDGFATVTGKFILLVSSFFDLFFELVKTHEFVGKVFLFSFLFLREKSGLYSQEKPCE